VTWSQSKETINDNDNYILIPKATHEELRQNITDYKNLISIYDKLKFEYQSSLETNTVDKERIISYQNQLIGLKDQIINQSSKIEILEDKLKDMSIKYAQMENSYMIARRNNDKYKSEIYAIKGYKQRFHTQGVIIGFLAAALLVVISTSN
jgi:predicted RNase H-like nuclease (RuvC/YqgF family)